MSAAEPHIAATALTAPRAAQPVATPVLWQRPVVAEVPEGFDVQVAQLHALLASIGQRYRRAALASSLSAEDIVLTHAIAASAAAIEVFVIDTGRLHPQTLALRVEVEAALGVRLQVVAPDAVAVARYVASHGADAFYHSVALRHQCCELRKVEPLARALAGRDAWLTGQRRAHGAERAQLAVEEVDAARAMAKFNPLAAWSDAALWHYVDRFGLPVSPLHAQGYPSIGCAPCTRPIRAGEDPRAGRWWWEQSNTKECGLHLQRAALAHEEKA